MSEQNVAVVRRWVELFNERDDAGEFLSLLDPEVELQTPGGPRLHGHGEARDWFEAGYENVQPRIISDRFVAAGDVVVGLGRTEVRWIESGEIAHRSESAGAFWLRDGKIIRWRPFERLSTTGGGEGRFRGGQGADPAGEGPSRAAGRCDPQGTPGPQ
jgi:limonene-1,2-epoxide hydrolase